MSVASGRCSVAKRRLLATGFWLLSLRFREDAEGRWIRAGVILVGAVGGFDGGLQGGKIGRGLGGVAVFESVEIGVRAFHVAGGQFGGGEKGQRGVVGRAAVGLKFFPGARQS